MVALSFTVIYSNASLDISLIASKVLAAAHYWTVKLERRDL